MRIRKQLTATTFALAFAFAGAALAGDAPSFEAADMNHDGAISKDEASKVEGLDFAKADTDKNGTLSKAEYQKATS